MRDLAELVEMNRFVGRELVLWLWFESELYETNLHPSGGDPCSLWLETQITLANEGEETRVKSSTPGSTPEAKQALRQGKLPTETRLHLVLGALEYTWKIKADDLAVATLKVPAELKADSDKYEALYERMHLVETLEKQLEALYADFIALRLDLAWENVVVPELKKWARNKPVDATKYEAAKARLTKRRSAKPEKRKAAG